MLHCNTKVLEQSNEHKNVKSISSPVLVQSQWVLCALYYILYAVCPWGTAILYPVYSYYARLWVPLQLYIVCCVLLLCTCAFGHCHQLVCILCALDLYHVLLSHAFCLWVLSQFCIICCVLLHGFTCGCACVWSNTVQLKKQVLKCIYKI